MNSQLKLAICCITLCFTFLTAGPVSYYGALTVTGNKIKGNSMDVQLKGPSFFWADGQNGLPFYTSDNVDWFVDTMDISVFRYAMPAKYYDQNGGTNNQTYDGYLLDANKASSQKSLIAQMVDAAVRNDVYVIIDWHSHRAQSELADAKVFFTEMATKYKETPNVIFEIYNEPSGYVNMGNATSTGSIAYYMQEVIDAIRATGAKNLILVGSSGWSSAPNAAAGYNWHTNSTRAPIAYTLHFYAGAHFTNGDCNANGANHKCNADKAMSENNAAVFVSEWGTTQASGSGAPDAGSTNQWTAWMNTNKISSCQWAVSSHESSSMFSQNTSNSISVNGLTISGNLLFEYMGGKKSPLTLGKTDPPSGWPWGRSQTVKGLKEGTSKIWTTSDLGISGGAVFDDAEAAEGTFTVENDKITYTVPSKASKDVVYANYWVKLGSNRSKHRLTLNISRGPQASINSRTVNISESSVTLNFSALGITHPKGNLQSGLGGTTFTSATVNLGTNESAGSVAISSDKKSLTYTLPANPVAGKTVILTYTVADNSGNSITKDVTLTFYSSTPILGTAQGTGNFEITARSSKLFAELSKSGNASLDIYSISGAKVKNLMSGNQSAGIYEFNVSNLQKGVYIVRLKQGSETKTQRIAIH